MRWCVPLAGETYPRHRRSWARTEAVARLVACGLGDPEVAAMLDADLAVITPTSLPGGGTRHGIEALAALRADFDRTWLVAEGARSDVRELGDDAVLVITTGAATCRATGQPLAVDIRTVVDFAADTGTDRIVSVRCWWRDTAAALVALGVWQGWA